MAKVPEVLLDWRDSPPRLTRTGSAYRTEAMFRLRAHYLARGPLREKPFSIWGAGPTGKRLARALEAHALRPRAFYDVSPKKRLARDLPVLSERELLPPGAELLVCAVGAAGARVVDGKPVSSLEPIARLLAERQALPEALLRRAQKESPTKSAFLNKVLDLGV